MNLERLVLRLSLVTVVCCALSVAANAQTVSKVFNNATLESVLDEIELQTGYSVICDSDRLNEHERITAEFHNTALEDVLEQILSSDFSFTIKDKMVVIHDNKAESEEKDAGKVSGIVTDSYGDPLPGASVIVKGTTNGVMTDEDGRFEMSDVTSDAVLEVTFLGFTTVEQKVGTRAVFSFVLEEDTQLLEELVVVGYGVQKRSDITGSVASVKTDELIASPSFSTSNALQGKVSGVMVQNNSGAPGSSPSIRIRGSSSLEFGNSPLVIIDGVNSGVGDLNTLNPNQIESMEVLKDAASLSIYGSSGANGAIIVTTKRGKGERGQVTYNGFVTVDNVAKYMPTLEAWEYATLFDEFQVAKGMQPHFGAEAIAAMGKGTNWQSELFRTAISHNHNISVSGQKKDIFSYYIAANIVNQQGIVRNSDYTNYTLRGNFNVKVMPKLDFTMNVSANYGESHGGASDVYGALLWAPTKPVYEEDGSYSQPESGGVGPVNIYNPVGTALEGVNDSFGGGFSASLKGEWRPWDFLSLSSQFIYKMSSSNSGYFENQVVNNGLDEDIAGSQTIGTGRSLQSTTILAFNKTWDKHSVQATGVYELTKGVDYSIWAGSRGIPVKMGYFGINYGSYFERPGTTYSSSATQSVMGRVNYAFDERYMVSASVRHDGASQLAAGNKFDTFWAVSAGWNLMNESFMQGIKPVLTDFKLRASYGTVGNAAVPAYSSHMLFSAGMDASENLTLTMAQAENKNLRWEKTREFNVAFDASLWDGRLNMTVEYYDKLTTDLLMWQQVPAVAIVTQTLNNVGSVSNKGWDFSIGGVPVSTRDFSWEINYTMNLNQNKVLKLDGINDEIISTKLDFAGINGCHFQKVGEPMSSFRGYIFAGTWKTDEASLAAMYDCVPGDAKYVDVNKDGKYDTNDMVLIGNAQPKGIYGINNTFRYKGFDLNIFFQGVWGNDVWNMNRVRRETYNDAFPSSPVIRDHWTPENQTEMPSFTGKEIMSSSRWLEDGSYLRLKNVTLGYTFPEKWMSKIKVSNLRVYVSGNNLYTFTKYSGYDPEASDAMDKEAGVDFGVYPSVRSFVFGIDLTF